MNFREFSEAYNDYLIHARSDKRSTEKKVTKEGNAIARYCTNESWKKYIMSGDVDSQIWEECLGIATNNNYSDSQKTAMIMNKLSTWFKH